MLNDQIEPERRLDLLHHVREFSRGYHFNRRLVLRERQEEGYDTFRDADLFALFMDISGGWVER